ncbi:HpcH/HpaI aldolase/citrate lyase family protein [Isoptericola sp. 4D.3]|uniref:HpcH/HpaI aldolase/citrate lyase family protein n=1 Tax=Isoptericola peretonis TaxID=2918523 RepID=A0ABT0J977_9MICO|nr:HpcH/HpaI aldolase/citrate lyase family protein [Isoptericola sp. 4D.3]
MKVSLDRATLEAVERRLSAHDAHLDRAYPGDDGTRQPVHTVYVPAHRYTAGLAGDWGAQARAVLDAQGTDALLDAVGVRADLREAVAAQVERKLAVEPIEDLRIDLEDGYGTHPDAAEDEVAAAAALALRAELDAGTATPFVGIRFKCFERLTRARGLRTLDVFVSTLAASGDLPEGLVLTLPKVTAVAQVEAMVAVCERLEEANGLPAGRLRFEVQVETPQSILDSAGTATVARMIHAGGGRVSGLHYGTYDYSASLGIAAAYQSMEHPAADLAKEVMQLAAAGTGVRLSDGSTNVLPVGDDAQVRAAWANHGRLVRRSLERGFYQGWDLHPAQLPSRFAATCAFYREGFEPAAQRLSNYVNRVEGAVLDEPATAKALAWFLKRGVDGGALGAEEIVERVGLQPAELTAMVTRPVGA